VGQGTATSRRRSESHETAILLFFIFLFRNSWRPRLGFAFSRLYEISLYFGPTTDTSAFYYFEALSDDEDKSADRIDRKDEIGDISVYVDFTSPEHASQLFQSESKREIIENGDQTDERGKKIGERAISVAKQKGRIVGVRIFWTEGNEFWSIDARTLDLATDFEQSKTFRELQAKTQSAFKHV
jgi:hypothetical protein